MRWNHQTLSKRYTDAILTPPYNAARKLQSVLRHDECEFIGNADQIGELQRRAGARYIADNARVLVAAVVDLGVLSPLLSEMIPMTDKDMLFLAGLAGFAWWTYVFLPLVWFHS